ncbi:hypothetical protein DdX_09578 [Ditylenchus destructor]|uniref:PPPDE domain-containing protein n=1 Tax=Ditylenchus destructor TaxID=166010 RepID=A0AAD4N1L3_9BILA|nr:hypothetical protein DdX_09578 [Ditylenchus destructor]
MQLFATVHNLGMWPSHVVMFVKTYLPGTFEYSSVFRYQLTMDTGASTGKPCECNTAYHRAYKAMIINVPQKNEGARNARKRAWDDIRRNNCNSMAAVMATLLIHQFVEVYFKCDNCGFEFSCTTEFDFNGKHWYWHEVGLSRRSLGCEEKKPGIEQEEKQSLLGSEIVVESDDIDRLYEFVKQEYDGMPDSGYSVFGFNCIHWAGKFYHSLT